MTDKELLPDYVDRRQWKFNPITGEPLIDGWPLYSGLPQREWKGLTDEEILADDVLRYHFGLNGGAGPVSKKGKAIIEAIEAKLNEKNHD